MLIYMEPGNHVAKIVDCIKKSHRKSHGEPDIPFWEFTFENEEGQIIRHSILYRESTKSVYWTLGAACGVPMTRAVEDDEVMSLVGKYVLIKVFKYEDSPFGCVVKWRSVPKTFENPVF